MIKEEDFVTDNNLHENQIMTSISRIKVYDQLLKLKRTSNRYSDCIILNEGLKESIEYIVKRKMKGRIGVLDPSKYVVDMTYTPDILFFNKYYADIITASLPLSTDYNILKACCKQVIDIALDNNISNLILNDFKCKESNYRPVAIMTAFKDVLRGALFNLVCFSIPDKTMLTIFDRILVTGE